MTFKCRFAVHDTMTVWGRVAEVVNGLLNLRQRR